MVYSSKNFRSRNKLSAEQPVKSFIPYTRHIDENTIRTKDGYLLQIIRLEGVPFETADQIDIDQKKSIRATLMRGLSNSRFAIYHHIIRKVSKEPLDGLFQDGWCQALDTAYQKRLSEKRMFVNEQYLTIVRRPAPGPIGAAANWSRIAFARFDQALQDQEDHEALKALKDAVASIISTLSPYQPRLLRVQETEYGLFSEPAQFLSYLINAADTKVMLPRMGLDQYLPAKRLSFGKESFEIRGAAPNDVKLGAVLSLKEYSDSTEAGIIDGLLRLPHELIVTQSFAFVDRQASLSAMRLTKRKLIAGEQGTATLELDIDEAIDDLTSGHSSFGEHHLTVTAFAQNPAELDRAISDTISSFVNLGIVAVREDLNMEPAYWAQLPGNFSYIARRSLISNRNFAGFASFHNFPSGRKKGNHWGMPITKLETTSGTPYWFSFHDRDVGNFTVIGPTGTGKTVLLTFLHAQAQRMNPKSIYFDKDRGAEIYLRAIGADYTVVRAGRPTGLNPLQLPDTPENKAFLREWVKQLIFQDSEVSPTPVDLQMIARAVSGIYELPPPQRKLSTLSELLGGHQIENGESLSAKIAMWHSHGERAWLFDNETDTLSFSNRTIGFDLTAILDDKTSRMAWLMYIFHRINGLLDGQKTIIMLDEGWKLLDDPAFSLRIKDWMKTIRKQNGIVGFATQSINDAVDSSVGTSIMEQSPTQIFLPNARATEQDYCKAFGLSQHELRIIRSLSPESRCFLIRHGTDSIIARLDLSGMEDHIAVLSGRTETVEIMNKLRAQHGDDPEIWLPLFHQERNRS